MIAVDVRHDATEVRRVLAGYARGADRVLLRTLNRTMPGVRARAAREIATELGVPVRVAGRALKVRAAFIGRLTTDLGADTKRIPLIHFSARRTAAGVTYKIGTQPRRLLPRAFINIGPKVGKTVLKRARQDDVFSAAGQRRFTRGVSEQLVGRDPALIKYGPSPAAIFVHEAMQKALDATAREGWVRELSSQIRFFLSKQPG